MHKGFLLTASLFCALAVALGAFGAHGLKQLLAADQIAVFDTGVRYQFYHSLALFITGILAEKFTRKWILAAGKCFIAGIILFSGSLYALTFLEASGNSNLKFIGAITPVGGLFFIAGWLLLFGAIRKSKNE